MHVDLNNLGFVVLDDLFHKGEEYVKELEGLKARDKAARAEEGAGGLHKKKKAGQTLREPEPW